MHTSDNEFIFYEWENNYFKVERLNDYNYYNIYNNKNGKKCGKDSYGNYLYFPENIDCPINKIVITNNYISSDIYNYKQLPLGNKYLYYTNENIEE